MNIEEAIEYMQDGVNAIHNECDTMLNNNSEIDDAFELIKEACEKQIAKKPIELPEEETFYDGGYYGHKCGMCEFPVYDDQIYCDKCGQKLDWGKE